MGKMRMERFGEALRERVLLLDGAMGTMLMRYGLREEDYRGEEFVEHGAPVRGNLDMLTLTRPDLVETVHRAYLNAGADIISTNTFGANAVRQREYGMAGIVERMNREGAEIARRVADDLKEYEPEREVWVAGVMGPAEASGGATREKLRAVYAEQAQGLLAGGADLILIETVMRVEGGAGACEGVRRAFEEIGEEVPMWVSATTNEAGDRMWSGEGFDELVKVAEEFGAVCVGVNCGYGPKSMTAGARVMAGLTELPVGAYPGAGLPDERGVYPVGAEAFGRWAREMVEAGLVRVVGGCCGTTPEHVRGMRRVIGATGREEE